MQASWVITIPPFRGSDEIDHVYRAAAVADGEFRVDEWAADGRGLYVTVPTSLVAAARFQCDRLDYTGPANCRPEAIDGSDKVRAASGAGNYHPAFYWLIGSVAQPFEGAAALYAMRIATAGLCLMFFGLAACAAARLPSRWPLAALTVALSPVLVYSTTIVAPNGPEMAAAAALWASLLGIVQEPDVRQTRRLLAIAVIAAVLLCTFRLLGPLFVLLIVGTVMVSDRRAAIRVLRRQPRAVAVGALPILLAAAGGIAWVLSTGSTDAPPGPKGGGSVDLQQLMVWNLQTIAAFPLRNQPGALIVYPIYLGMVGALAVGGLRRGTTGARCSIVLAAALTLALPVALTVATMEGRGVIWQGRYLLPYSLGLVVLAGVALSRRHIGALSRRTGATAAVGIWVAVAACLVKIRNDEVAGGVESAWLVPPALLLVILTGAAVGCWAAAVSGPKEAKRA